MKKIIFGFIALTSVSAFASNPCSYIAVGEDGYRLHLAVTKSVKIVEKVLAEKGYTRVFEESRASYKVDFFTDISTGAWNGLENETFGDNYAKASLERIADSKILYSASESGVSGIVAGVAKKAKSRVLLNRILSNFPECSQL